MTFLDYIQMELENMGEDLITPNSPVRPTDKVVGTADLALRKLYSLGMQLEQTAIQTIMSTKYARGNTPDLTLAAKSVTALQIKSQAIAYIVHATICDQFDLWDKTNIRICAGWQIAFTDDACMRTQEHLPNQEF